MNSRKPSSDVERIAITRTQGSAFFNSTAITSEAGGGVGSDSRSETTLFASPLSPIVSNASRAAARFSIFVPFMLLRTSSIVRASPNKPTVLMSRPSQMEACLRRQSCRKFAARPVDGMLADWFRSVRARSSSCLAYPRKGASVLGSPGASASRAESMAAGSLSMRSRTNARLSIFRLRKTPAVV